MSGGCQGERRAGDDGTTGSENRGGEGKRGCQEGQGLRSDRQEAHHGETPPDDLRDKCDVFGFLSWESWACTSTRVNVLYTVRCWMPAGRYSEVGERILIT